MRCIFFRKVDSWLCYRLRSAYDYYFAWRGKLGLLLLIAMFLKKIAVAHFVEPIGLLFAYG
jgi:hypothetical protein